MSFVFRSEEFTARYHVPSYARWLGACDMTPAYEWHRLVLQVLQRRFTQHALGAEVAGAPALAADAAGRVPRRAPRRHPSRSADGAGLGHQPGRDPAMGAQRRRRLRRHRALPRRPLPHGARRPRRPRPRTARSTACASITRTTPRSWPIRSAPCRRSPTRSVSRSTTQTEAAMHAYLDDHPQGAHGEHRYSFDDLGFDPDQVRAASRATSRSSTYPTRCDAMADPTERAEWHQLPRRSRRARRAHRERRVPGPPIDPDEGYRHVAQQLALLAELGDRSRRPDHARRSSARTTSSRCGAAPTPTTCTGTLASTPAARTGSAGG